ncbi:hypothetical protein NEOLEDRAFT_1070346 [Neolentinus lepideus HHB14362 ss-1]|uniref:Bromodomain associated domain-containing protein n=1 Tax=Neolentinus lepideus HHB14362 ss-1 TaxID=1314782 RepID=A0A165QY77_9AGAM|nr:hypothetical protein NEOLEDRAFT_1070346 [Neolentinus lepideus HHB14362 ss-1]
MDVNTHKLLDSATIRTLHAQNFSRSSTEAAHVLTDLLSRYLTLLSQSCKKYAEQAGRLNLSARDASCALEEMGVSIEELKEYCGTEGKELGRYALQTRNRLEDLKEYKAVLSEGLRQQREAIPLVYAPVPHELLWSEEVSEEEEDELVSAGTRTEDQEKLGTGEDQVEDRTDEATQKEDSQPGPSSTRRATSPPLPLSPVSNPASPPPRKRQRTDKWPDHIPDFFPPFPGDLHTPSRTPSPKPTAQFVTNRPEPLPTPLTQPLAPPSSSDYLTSVPYAESSISSVPEWHLPEPMSTHGFQAPISKQFDLPTPQTQPSLLAAYHHILTHPPPPTSGGGNPGRHKVAMGLLTENQLHPRWDPPDTLFGSIQPCPPRVSVMMPSYAMPINATPTPADGKGDKTSDPNKEKKSLPSAPPKTVVPTERIAPMLSQQGSRIPELAKNILPSSVYTRATRLAHPPVLMRGNQKLTYGSGLNAPWNSTPLAGGKAKDTDVQDDAPKVLPDARFYATWDYEPKHFWEEIGNVKRARTGSINMSASASSGRTKSSK